MRWKTRKRVAAGLYPRRGFSSSGSFAMLGAMRLTLHCNGAATPLTLHCNSRSDGSRNVGKSGRNASRPSAFDQQPRLPHGTNSEPHVYAHLCSNTIEERIEEILSEKRALLADVIDGVDTAALRRLDLDLLMNALERDFVGD
jgi:hypothetical protein